MRRLTLILSDLYLPADARKESFPDTLQLPALEWLLRFAGCVEGIDDWRRWLARDLGAPGLADISLAQLHGFSFQTPARGVWLATPVALEARLDHVRLRDRGLLRLSPEQGLALSSEFLRTFGPGHSLRAGDGLHLLLDGGPDADIRTLDPARLLDADIGKALPAGSKAAGELRRLGAEIEMWLPGTRINADRERAGQPRISALWLWGGGAVGPEPSKQWKHLESFRVFGADSSLSALANLISDEPRFDLPKSFADMDGREHTYAQFEPMSGSRSESLTELERHWFAPARDALKSGALERLRIVANDRMFEVAARDGWKFWRGRRGWLESLR